MGYFRLCGGTLFTLIVDAAMMKPTNGELFTGAENLINDANMLTGLLRIAMPSLPDVSRDDAQNFKQCNVKQSKNLRMVNCEIGNALRDRMNSDYASCFQEMSAYISKFIDLPQGKDQKLVKALLELIGQDQSILPEQSFRVCPNGNALSKRDMADILVINIPSFLLGVLLFTLTEITDNRIGKDTYDAWCPSSGNKRTRRYYQGQMGESFNRAISFDNSFESVATTVKESAVVVPLTGESKKHPLPQMLAPEIVGETERRYVSALLDVYREKIGEPDLTLEGLSSHPDLDKHLKRQRDDYYYAETLRRGTRDVYSEDGKEYFSIFLEEIYSGVIDTFEQEYNTGFARLGAVLTVAAQTSTEQCFLTQDTRWIGNHEKKGACHILVNRQKLSGWV